ncbi:cell division protein ZapA [Spirochaetia bacterium]|nr:cell division protein ZapA [Spirochaetia bacterium]
MPKSGLRIDILGTSFSISADEESAYLDSLLNQYRLVIENTQKTTGLKDPLKVAIVAGFLLCDEIQKLHKQPSSKSEGILAESREAEQLTLDLIARIDEALDDKA